LFVGRLRAPESTWQRTPAGSNLSRRVSIEVVVMHVDETVLTDAVARRSMPQVHRDIGGDHLEIVMRCSSRSHAPSMTRLV